MARLAFAFVFLGCAASFAPPVEILWRPSLLGNQAILDYFNVRHPGDLTDAQRSFWNRIVEGPDAIGHVAIRVPMQDGAKAFGWHPVSTANLPEGHPMRGKKQSALIEWLATQDRSGQFPSVPGRLKDDTDWAERGVTDGPDHTRVMTLDVSEAQLSQIKRNLLRMQTEGWNYQLLANRDPVRNRSRYQGRNANCVAAIAQFFEGTGIPVDFIPEDGSMSALYRNAKSRSNEWRSVCSAVLAF